MGTRKVVYENADFEVVIYAPGKGRKEHGPLHLHVFTKAVDDDGTPREAQFWLHHGIWDNVSLKTPHAPEFPPMSRRELHAARQIVTERIFEFTCAWRDYFKGTEFADDLLHRNGTHADKRLGEVRGGQTNGRAQRA